MRNVVDGGKRKKGEMMTGIAATNIVASWPPNGTHIETLWLMTIW